MRRGCNELYGFWNTYWMRSRWAVVRLRADGASRSTRAGSRRSTRGAAHRSTVTAWSCQILIRRPAPGTRRGRRRRLTSCTTWWPVYEAHTSRTSSACVADAAIEADWACIRWVRAGISNGRTQRTSRPGATSALGGELGPALFGGQLAAQVRTNTRPVACRAPGRDR